MNKYAAIGSPCLQPLSVLKKSDFQPACTVVARKFVLNNFIHHIYPSVNPRYSNKLYRNLHEKFYLTVWARDNLKGDGYVFLAPETCLLKTALNPGTRNTFMTSSNQISFPNLQLIICIHLYALNRVFWFSLCQV